MFVREFTPHTPQLPYAMANIFLLQYTKIFLPSLTEKFAFLHITSSVMEPVYHNVTIYALKRKKEKKKH
jgi:hypothetical protein